MKVIVDTTVIVPVNVAALLDDTDFKTRETAVAFNAAGMDLVWNFMTVAGVVTQTAVTPTSGGNYNWAHLGDAMYTIGIPASGGASINNDTEGFGWFTGIATGVLPWVGPIIQFSPANIVNSTVVGSDLLDVSVVQLNGSTVSQSGGLINANVTQISSDATAADNAEAFFDGTGYNGANNVIPTVTAVTNMVSANVTQISGDSGAADNLEAEYDGTGFKSYIRKNTATGGGAASINLDAGASATNDIYNNTIVVLVSGTGAGQANYISDYNGTSKVATVRQNWAINPDATTGYMILPLGLAIATAAETSQVIWAETVRTITGMGAAAINEAAFHADTTKYQARIWLVDDDGGSTDRYIVIWYKNGQPITTGITSPTIQVFKVADGTDLVAATAMTQIGSTGTYRYTEASNRIVDGVGYIIKITATIDGATRTEFKPIGRDS